MKTTQRTYLLIFSLFFLCCGTISAQKNSFYVGPMGSAGLYSVTFIQPNAFPPIKYKVKTGFSYGFLANYALTKGFAIRGSLEVVHRNYGLEYKWIFIQPNDPLIPVSITMKADYRELSAGGEFCMLKKEKVLLFISGSYCMGSRGRFKEITKYASGRTEETDDLDSKPAKWLSSFPVSAGVQLTFSNRLQFRAEPYFRFYTGRLEDRITISNPKQFGMAVSILVAIK